MDPALGTMDDLEALAAELRGRGMSLCVDLVMNHTAREHLWAQKAVAGDSTYRHYYLLFPDRQQPDAYERTLREVFPDFAPGSFSFVPETGEWVWTTFNGFQWDLNYANPDVFCAMFTIMAQLANRGVEILRLDAVPFIWKRLGTDCENQPEVHDLLAAFRALLAVVAPAVVLKAEAIVPPAPLVRYLGAGDPERQECELAYHNQLMVMMWSSLATGEARLMGNALGADGRDPGARIMGDLRPLPRRHRMGRDRRGRQLDGVGRSLASPVPQRLLLRRVRRLLRRGESCSSSTRPRAMPRISGTAASLAGVEAALTAGDPRALGVALARLELLYAVAFAFGGPPLVYMGDELALGNDRSYLTDAARRDDSRWLHRPHMDWTVAAARSIPGTVESRMFAAMQRLAAARARLPQLHGGARTSIVPLAAGEVLCFRRKHRRELPLWVLANFAPREVAVPYGALPVWEARPHRLALAGGGALLDGAGALLPPYAYLWLTV